MSTETEEKTYRTEEPWKTLTVTDLSKRKYVIKFQHSIDVECVKKEIIIQAMSQRNEHLPLDLIMLVHNPPNAVCFMCRKDHIFLTDDDDLLMMVRSRMCTMDHSKGQLSCEVKHDN